MLPSEAAADAVRSRYGLPTSDAPCGASVHAGSKPNRSTIAATPSVPPAALRPEVVRPAFPSPRYLQLLHTGFESFDSTAGQSTISFLQTESTLSSRSRLLAESLTRPSSSGRTLSATELRQLTHQQPKASVVFGASIRSDEPTAELLGDSCESWTIPPSSPLSWSLEKSNTCSSLKDTRRVRKKLPDGTIPPLQLARRHVKRMRARRKREVRDPNDSNSEGDDDETGQAVRTAGAVLGEPAQVVHQVKKTNPFVEYDTKEKRLQQERRWLTEDQEYLECRVREAQHSTTQAKLTMKLAAKTFDRPLTRHEALMAEIKQRKGVQPRPSMNWTRSLKVMQRELREPVLLQPSVEEAQAEAPTIKRSDSIGTKLFAGGLSFLINKAKTG
mmetsp:Transcript_29896/g.54438  ORF Transcript_29896/g.54438 Transcript_29896/m.54438 type:complete len:387 (-) Transcript_29896:175-1335(-)